MNKKSRTYGTSEVCCDRSDLLKTLLCSFSSSFGCYLSSLWVFLPSECPPHQRFRRRMLGRKGNIHMRITLGLKTLGRRTHREERKQLHEEDAWEEDQEGGNRTATWRILRRMSLGKWMLLYLLLIGSWGSHDSEWTECLGGVCIFLPNVLLQSLLLLWSTFSASDWKDTSSPRETSSISNFVTFGGNSTSEMNLGCAKKKEKSTPLIDYE